MNLHGIRNQLGHHLIKQMVEYLAHEKICLLHRKFDIVEIQSYLHPHPIFLQQNLNFHIFSKNSIFSGAP
jgi:hypothetical protein